MDWRTTWDHHASWARKHDPQTQVMRTVNKEPCSDEVFRAIMETVQGGLQLNPDEVLLDLCCGNGVMTKPLAALCARVWGVDFCGELLRQMGPKPDNIVTICKSALDVRFGAVMFDKILMYAGLQYFTPAETVRLFKVMYRWLKPGGRVYLGDLPNLDQTWRFFDTPERQTDYFKAVEEERAIVGTWFSVTWLIMLAKHTGFWPVSPVWQQYPLPFRHYRFDLLLEKK